MTNSAAVWYDAKMEHEGPVSYYSGDNLVLKDSNSLLTKFNSAKLRCIRRLSNDLGI